MEPIWWIIGVWALISVICYYFVVYRRSIGPKVPEIKIDDGNAIVSAEAQKRFEPWNFWIFLLIFEKLDFCPFSLQ